MNAKTMKGFMVGYGAKSVGYRVMNLTDNTVVVKRYIAIDVTDGAAMTPPRPQRRALAKGDEGTGRQA